MSQSVETISSLLEKDDEQSKTMTSEDNAGQQTIKQEEVERLKHQSGIEAKSKYYESQCWRFGLQKIKMVQRCLKEELGSEVLDISDYGIGTLQCQIMLESFKKFPATFLTSVNMKNNHIEYSGCYAIASFLQISESLKKLILEGCKLGDEGVEIISRGVSKSLSLVHLNVSNCCISDIGGEALVKSFLLNAVCEEIVMASNFLAMKTSKALEEVLTSNSTLKTLNLSYNSFYEDNAITNVLKGLMKNEQLEYLDLSWNALSGKPFGMILSKSIRASKLKMLKMEYNRMGTFELKKLAVGLKFSKTIKEVYIEGNSLTGEDLNLLNVFNSKSPLELISFGKWFHLSQDAFKLLQDVYMFKPFVKVIYQNVLLPNPPREVNMLDIYTDRIKYLAMSPKKKLLQKDMGVFMTQLRRHESAFLAKPNLRKMLKGFKAKTNESLMEKYFDEFKVPNDGQERVNIHLMADYYLNRHPYTTAHRF